MTVKTLDLRRDGPSAAVRIRVMKRDRFRCTYCGVPGTDAELEIDHIVAVSKGGSHHMSNLTTACRACNQQKGDGDAPKRVTSHNDSAKDSNSGLLSGMFLHTYESREIKFQGRVLRSEGQTALVQLYSWLSGDATDVIVMQVSDLIDRSQCHLYATHEAWIAAAERPDDH